MDVSALLRHQVAALHYRTERALDGAAEGFGEFRPAPDVRSPTALLVHMAQLVTYARSRFLGVEFEREEGGSYAEARARFDTRTRELIRALDGLDPDPTTVFEMTQGPIADALSHTGQLAMLRRLAGDPIAPTTYMDAPVDADALAEGIE